MGFRKRNAKTNSIYRKTYLPLRSMTRIKAFRAWRYNRSKIHDINRKFSPLFDVVNARQLEELYNIPNNSIHISVPRSHEQVMAKLQQWKRDGIICQDPIPSIYVYYQQFSLFGEKHQYIRKGFISMISMEESEIVLHEDTMTSSVNDRITLLEKTLLNVAPTHGLYFDPEFELEILMDSYMQNPLYEYIDYQGVINKLAIIQDPEDIAKIVDHIASRKIYLADGHHRLESSRIFWESRKSEADTTMDSIMGYHLIYLTNLASDDLRILPTHRLWKPQYDPDIGRIIKKLKKYFSFIDITSSRRPVYEMLKGLKRTFGLISKDRQWLIQLKPKIDPLKAIPLDIPDVLKQQDYTLLHYFVFDRVLGYPYAKQQDTLEISYEKEYASAVAEVNAGRAAFSFIANDVQMEEMMAICDAGAKMPRKSTYFYPKVVCGLVFGSIDENENNSSFDIGL